jgi:hypothetical protein
MKSRKIFGAEKEPVRPDLTGETPLREPRTGGAAAKKTNTGKTQTPPTKKIGRKGEQRCSDLDATRKNNENCIVQIRFDFFIELQMRLQL